MIKNIAVRGKKDIVAVFNRYAQISGQQDTGRPQATLNFIDYVANLPMNEDTAAMLKAASKQRVDETGIEDSAVPSFIKIPVDVEDGTWDKAMEIFKYVFKLQGNPQMPYFLRVAGTAFIKNLEKQNAELGIINTKMPEDTIKEVMTIDEFKGLNTEEKLNEIYKLLLERRM